MLRFPSTLQLLRPGADVVAFAVVVVVVVAIVILIRGFALIQLIRIQTQRKHLKPATIANSWSISPYKFVYSSGFS